MDVRHEASHNELPSLSLLRVAAERALDWLKECYWRRQAENISANQRRIAQLLKAKTFAKQSGNKNLVAILLWQ